MTDDAIFTEFTAEARTIGVSLSDNELALLPLPTKERSRVQDRIYKRCVQPRETIHAFVLVSLVARHGQGWLARQLATPRDNSPSPIHAIAVRVLMNSYLPTPPPTAGMGLLLALVGLVVAFFSSLDVGVSLVAAGVLYAVYSLFTWSRNLLRLRRDPDYVRVAQHLRTVVDKAKQVEGRS